MFLSRKLELKIKAFCKSKRSPEWNPAENNKWEAREKIAKYKFLPKAELAAFGKPKENEVAVLI